MATGKIKIERPGIMLSEILELFSDRQEIIATAVKLRVILFRGADDDINDPRKTAATFSAFFHGVVKFHGNNQLPAILIEQFDDGFLNFTFRDDVAVTGNHFCTNLASSGLTRCNLYRTQTA